MVESPARYTVWAWITGMNKRKNAAVSWVNIFGGAVVYSLDSSRYLSVSGRFPDMRSEQSPDRCEEQIVCVTSSKPKNERYIPEELSSHSCGVKRVTGLMNRLERSSYCNRLK